MVFTIDTDTLKVKKFEVGRILTYTSSNATSVSLYPKDDLCSQGIAEDKCFSSEAELITYVTAKNDAKAL